MKFNGKVIWQILSVMIMFALTACGGGGGSTPTNSSGVDQVAASLNALGINTTPTPLTDSSGAILPPDYTPVGLKPKTNTLDELMLLGATPDVNSMYDHPTTIKTITTNGVDPTTGSVNLLDGWDYGDPWNGTDWTRGGASGDLNGDGRDEELIAYQRKAHIPDPANNPVELKVLENTDPNGKYFSVDTPPIFISNASANFLDVVTGDFDGDGQLDAAVVLMEQTQIEIVFLKNTDGVLALSGQKIVIPATVPTNFPLNELQAVVKVGNLDRDGAQELAVVVNAYQQIDETQPSGIDNVSHYYLFDDANHNFAPIPVDKAGDLIGTIQSTFSGTTKTVQDGNVALADLDGDGMDEIILGGIENNGGSTIDNLPSLTVYNGNKLNEGRPVDITYMVQVLDDVQHGLAELAHVEKGHTPVIQSAGYSKSCVPAGIGVSFTITCTYTGTVTNLINYMQLNAVDLDGTGTYEIQANEFVFNSNLTNRYTIPLNNFMFDGQDGDPTGLSTLTQRFTWRSTSMVAGNFLHLSDGRQQIAVHSETVNQQLNGVNVFGLDNSGNFTVLSHFPAYSFTGADTMTQNKGGATMYTNEYAFPTRSLQLVPTNVNDDTLTAEYVPGSHQFSYTEPIIIAALAAAPCWANQTQTLGNCYTSYGSGSTFAVTNDFTTTLSGSVTIGGELGVGVGKVEVDLTKEFTFANTVEESFNVSRTITYTTGPLQDSVIISSWPLDIYTYKVIHDPSGKIPDGTNIQVKAPRAPVTSMVSVDYYNAHVVQGGMKIDSRIFTHTPGVPTSYMRQSDMTQLSTSNHILPNPIGFAVLNGMNVNDNSFFEGSPATVGQGTGYTTTTLDLEKASSNTRTVGYNCSGQVKLTVGEVAANVGASGWVNLSVGAGGGKALAISHGSSQTYSGTVSNMATYDSKFGYNYGLFTYYYTDSSEPNHQFEVVNYWVDPN
jgi:hypothetical protein